jgi:hypothetical protein
MRRTSLIATALLAFLSIPLFAESTTDREKLVQELERTSAKFLKSVQGLSEAQWNYKAAPERWSIAQCAEHIAAAEPFIRGAIVKSMEAPASEEMLKQGVQKDEAVSKFIVDRSTKFKAPEPLVPSDRFHSPAAAVESFKKERAETIKLAAGDADMRNHALQHPGFGPLDAYGWMLFLSGHSERHTLQIDEVKADPGFPKE